MTARIRLITFDAYNTLFKPRGSLSAQYAKEAANVGIRVSKHDITYHFGSAYKRQLQLAPLYGIHKGMASQHWWEELVYATFLDAGVSKKQLDMKFDQLFQAIYTRFRTAEGYALFPDVVPTLNELKRRGFQMGVISNSDDCLVDVIQSLRLDHYFDFILPSCMAGFEKPHGRIFQKALTLASPGITPEAALHIGDDLQKDYWGAANAGWHAVLLQRGKLSYEDYAPALATDPTHRYPRTILTLQDLYPLTCTIYRPQTHRHDDDNVSSNEHMAASAVS